MRRAALYTRVSTRAQADKHGTAYQLAALQGMADTRGWSRTIYSDEGVSGRKQSRPGLDAMMLAVRRGAVDVVAVWRFDRFARSLSHLLAALAEFKAREVQFVSHQEGIDTGTPLGVAMFSIAGAFAELESNLARERVQAGVDNARAHGIILGRPALLTAEQAHAAIAAHGGVRGASRALSVGTGTIRRALERT